MTNSDKICGEIAFSILENDYIYTQPIYADDIDRILDTNLPFLVICIFNNNEQENILCPLLEKN